MLKPGGSLFLTVPFGVYSHMGVQQQFDRNLLPRAEEAFGSGIEVSETFYRYTIEGWNVTDAKDCANCEYVTSSVHRWAGNQGSGPPLLEPDLKRRPELWPA